MKRNIKLLQPFWADESLFSLYCSFCDTTSAPYYSRSLYFIPPLRQSYKPSLSNRPRHMYPKKLYYWCCCEIGFSFGARLIGSVRLVPKAISHSRHVLLPVSSMNLLMNDFSFRWTCTALKCRQWPGQAVLGGCLYIMCQDDMLFKMLWAADQKEMPPLFFVPRISIWERDQTALMQYFILFWKLRMRQPGVGMKNSASRTQTVSEEDDSY